MARNLSSTIAWRYLFAKKSTHAINLITGISVVGTMIGTAALILILSVFNGFETVIMDMIGKLNPDIRITPVEGKTFVPDDELLTILTDHAEIDTWSMTLEEVALFEYDGSQDFGTIKGIDSRFSSVTDIDSVIIQGDSKIFDKEYQSGIFGIGIATKLGLSPNDRISPVSVYMPKMKRSKFSSKLFTSQQLFVSGIFSIQHEKSYEYVLAPIDVVRDLLGMQDGQVSSIEIKVKDAERMEQVTHDLKSRLSPEFEVLDRVEQDASFTKIIRVEKTASFVIFTLILLLIAFNLIGALWMIVLDKKLDIAVLRSMGLAKSFVKRIFIKEGLLISGIGIFLGMLLALIIYFLHQRFGLVPVQPNFMLERYPVELRISDFVLTAGIVIFIAFLASLPPAGRAQRIGTIIREE